MLACLTCAPHSANGILFFPRQHKRVASGKPWEVSITERQIAGRVQRCLQVSALVVLLPELPCRCPASHQSRPCMSCRTPSQWAIGGITPSDAAPGEVIRNLMGIVIDEKPPSKRARRCVEIYGAPCGFRSAGIISIALSSPASSHVVSETKTAALFPHQCVARTRVDRTRPRQWRTAKLRATRVHEAQSCPPRLESASMPTQGSVASLLRVAGAAAMAWSGWGADGA
jgi:hypothetical protein